MADTGGWKVGETRGFGIDSSFESVTDILDEGDYQLEQVFTCTVGSRDDPPNPPTRERGWFWRVTKVAA